MDLESIMLSKASQMEKGQQLCYFTHMWDIKQKATNEQTNKTHRYRRYSGGYKRGRRLGEDRESEGGQIHGEGREQTSAGEHTTEYTDTAL